MLSHKAGVQPVLIVATQAALLDSLFGTERGLSANSELRAEINELITQLEAGSPNAAPNEVSPMRLLPCRHSACCRC